MKSADEKVAGSQAPRLGRRAMGAASRERLLAAATALFAERGYAGTSVDRVAERAGIAKTALYYHFGNKEGILAAVLERAAITWIEGIREAASQGGPPLERLDRALAGMRALVEENPWIVRLLQMLALEVAGRKPEVRATLRAILHRAREAIVSGMREALGLDLPDVETVAGVILGLLDGISLGALVDPEAFPLDRAFAELRRITIFLVGVRLDPALEASLDRWAAQAGRASGALAPAERSE